MHITPIKNTKSVYIKIFMWKIIKKSSEYVNTAIR